MKRNKRLLAGALLVVGALAAMTGCEIRNGNVVEKHDPYDVAVSMGAEGSVGEWLAGNETAPTEARRMYEEARKDGFDGSYIDFLKEIGSADPSAAVNKALLSVVDVFAEFEKPGSHYASIGSGVIYDLDKEEGNAYIVTNYHIIYNAASNGLETIPHISDELTVCIYGSEYTEAMISATYVGGAMTHDIAVLKVEGSEVLKKSDVLELTAADSDTIAVGEQVYAVGNADNRGISAVSGVVSVDAEYLSDIYAADEKTSVSMLEIRTDAAVNHGNSGGGLFNEDGALIGIVNARSEKDGVLHFGYAIPSNLALAIAQNIIDNSKINTSKGALRATLGITVQTAESRAYRDESTGKVYTMETISIQEVTPGSVSAGKLKVGDVICALQINDGKVKNITRLHMIGNTLFNVRKGNTLTVTVLRGDDKLEFALEFTGDEAFTLFQ